MKWCPIFSPSSPRLNDWKLPTMISVAVFMHGIAFYLIQASPPEPKNKPISSSRLSILDKTRPADLALLQWIENHDPASIAIQGHSPQPPPATFEVVYQPSYETSLPDPLPIALAEGQTHLQTFFPPGPVPQIVGNAPAAGSPFFELPTRIVTSNSLKLMESDKLLPPKIGNKLPAPTQFLIVFSATAEEKFYFLTQSSGDESLDAYARSWLGKSKISLAEGQGSGWITLHWGQEIWKESTP